MVFKFFNYAQAVKDAEEIKGARLKNQLQGLAVEEKTEKAENLKKAREIRSLHQNAPARIQALQDAGLVEEANALIESELETLKTGVDVAKALRDGLTPDNWKATRQQLIERGAFEPEFMPKDYSDKWLREREKEAKRNMEKISVFVEDPETGTRGLQDRLYQDGQEVERSPIYDPQEASKTGAGGDGGITPAMSNSIGRTVAQLFDSIYNPGTGEISITDPEQRPKVLAIRNDAESLVLQGMTPAAAVERAAKKYGIKRPGSDPANIRNFLQ